MRRSAAAQAGFTLAELMVVAFIVVMMMLIALPQFLPVIAFSEHEGAARHVANYGRSAMAYAELHQESILVVFDLDEQIYYAERIPDPYDFESDTDTEMELTGYDEEEEGRTTESDFSLMADDELADLDETALQEKGQQVQERFERFARMALASRARNVEQDDFLGDVGPDLSESGPDLSDVGPDLDVEGEEEDLRILDPLLEPTRVPEGVEITGIDFGGRKHTSDKVEIEVSPLGLMEAIEFYVRDGEGDYFTVTWDPITGGAHLEEGRAGGGDDGDGP
jgi:type II secretory pathway pseudopilin PulG